MPGMTYAMVAKNRRTTKTCTISSLPKGKAWKISVTTKLPWQATAGGNQNKKFTF